MKKVSFTRNCAFTVIARSAATWQSMPAPAMASNWDVGLLGSDPNSALPRDTSPTGACL